MKRSLRSWLWRVPVAQDVDEELMGAELQRTSLLLIGVVGFVLLMCCASVAHLLLARTTARARQLAVRTALGTGRGRSSRRC